MTCIDVTLKGPSITGTVTVPNTSLAFAKAGNETGYFTFDVKNTMNVPVTATVDISSDYDIPNYSTEFPQDINFTSAGTKSKKVLIDYSGKVSPGSSFTGKMCANVVRTVTHPNG